MSAFSVDDDIGEAPITISELRNMLRSELAPLKASLEFVVSEATDPWELIHTEVSNIAKNCSTTYRDQICAFYGITKSHYCMVLGRVTHCSIISAYIWPNLTGGRGLDTFGLTSADMTNPRNFLRLHDKVEKAFDRKRLTFLPVDASNVVSLVVVILDPALRSEPLVYNNETISMESLDGKVFNYKFPADKTPFLRLLAVHALRAHEKAVENRWILNDTALAERKARVRELARLSLEQNDPKFVMQRFFNDT